MRSTFIICYIVALQIQGYSTHDEVTTVVTEPCTLNDGNNGKCVNKCFDPEYLFKKDINEHECLQFGKHCCKSLVQKEDVLTSPNRTNIEKLCATTYRKYGDTIPPNARLFFDPRLQLPHITALGYGTEDKITYSCSGSLITDKYLLTAAHCIKSKEFGEVKFIRAGDFNVNSNTDDKFAQNFKVMRSIIHPDYNDSLIYHDIALIELDEIINETEYVKPACLPVGRDMVLFDWMVAGWGALGFSKKPFNELKQIYVHDINIKECNNFFNGNQMFKMGVVEDLQICAQDLNNNTCQGDTGGPLQISLRSQNSYLRGNTIVGIASHAKVCGITKTPGIYTKVSHYLKWIQSVIMI